MYRSVIRAKALDTLRGLLPAATTIERRPVRHRPGVRSAAAADVRAPARRSPRLRAADARRAAAGDSGVSGAGRSAGPRRPLGRVSRRHAARDSTAAARPFVGRRCRRAAREVTLTDFDPDGEIEGGGGGAVLRVRDCPTISCSRSPQRMTADDRAALLRAYVGNRTNRRHKPGRAFERTQLPLRRPRRLRRVPRSAAPPPADARVAAAQRRGTDTSSRPRSRRPARSTTGAR